MKAPSRLTSGASGPANSQAPSPTAGSRPLSRAVGRT